MESTAKKRRKVIAIGLDALDPEILEKFVNAGDLPNLSQLMASGIYHRLENAVDFSDGRTPFSNTEGCWVAYQTGARPQQTGYWSTVNYDPERYLATSAQETGGYNFDEYPPFYALGENYRVAAFDVPVSKLHAEVNGPQLLGWGGHFPFVKRGSKPESLFEDINQRHGKNGVIFKDTGVFWNPKYHRWLEKELIKSIRTRSLIYEELLKQGPWDLLMVGFDETHSAGHSLLFGSDPRSPLHPAWHGDHDPILSVLKEIDLAVGRIKSHVDDETVMMCFSVHGMKPNYSDLPNYLLLPELMYRFNFPGRIGFAKGDPSMPPGNLILNGLHWYWFGEIWRIRHSSNTLLRKLRSKLPAWLMWTPPSDILFPYAHNLFGPKMMWMPSSWYRKVWPQMRAFALPAFAEGQIRINLKGRDAEGRVSPDEYETECNRVSEFLKSVKNPRTGQPWVEKIVRTRDSALVDDPKLPHADLVVVYNQEPTDVVDSPIAGRIGPVPYYRTGGHRATGFALASGADITLETEIGTGNILDLAPTILHILGAPQPEYMTGSPLF